MNKTINLATYVLRAGILIMATIFVISSISCNTRNETKKASHKVVLIVFLQSDLKSTSPDDVQNFELIWDSILNKLFAKIFDTSNNANVKKIFFFPLNKITKNSSALINEDISALIKGPPYKIKKNFEAFLQQAKNNHLSILKAPNNDFQDILGSYFILHQIRDCVSNDISEDDITVIKVVYISDMIHYEASINDMDSERGIFNFASDFSVGKFIEQLANSRIGPSPKIEPIFNNKQQLEIYSVCLGRDNAVSDPHLVNGAWRKFFTIIGATKIELFLHTNSLDQIL